MNKYRITYETDKRKYVAWVGTALSHCIVWNEIHTARTERRARAKMYAHASGEYATAPTVVVWEGEL